jgi:hypothetical protein
MNESHHEQTRTKTPNTQIALTGHAMRHRQCLHVEATKRTKHKTIEQRHRQRRTNAKQWRENNLPNRDGHPIAAASIVVIIGKTKNWFISQIQRKKTTRQQ